MPTQELYEDDTIGGTPTRDSDSGTGGSGGSGGGGTIVRSEGFFGADWTEEEQADYLESTRRIGPPREFDNYERIPIRVLDSNLVIDSPAENARYAMTYLKNTQFLMANPTDAKVALLPDGRSSYYLEVIKDDIDTSKVFKLYYPLHQARHPGMKFFRGTGQVLASSYTEESLEVDITGGEGAEREFYDLMEEKASKVGGIISDFNYDLQEELAMQERFGAPGGSTIEGMISSTIDAMAIEILTSTIRYGHTFHKLKEGELSEDRLSNPIFTDEEDQGVAPSATISATDLFAAMHPDAETY